MIQRRRSTRAGPGRDRSEQVVAIRRNRRYAQLCNFVRIGLVSLICWEAKGPRGGSPRVLKYPGRAAQCRDGLKQLPMIELFRVPPLATRILGVILGG